MADMPSFTTDDLRLWMEALCSSLEVQGMRTIVPGHDYYWTFLVEDAFAMKSDPPIGAGQISDDINDLRSEILSTTDPDLSDHVIAFHVAEHLAGLLNYIALVSGAGIEPSNLIAAEGKDV